MRILTVLLAMLVLGGSAQAQEKKGKGLQLKDLPCGRTEDSSGQSQGR